MGNTHWAWDILTCMFFFMSCQVYVLILLSFFVLFIFGTWFFLMVALCNSVARNWMLWFLLVTFLLRYCVAFKPTWRKNAFSGGEFKMKNKNRTTVIGSEASRDCKSDAKDISVLLSTRGPGRNSWSQRQAVCTGLCPHCIWLFPLEWIYIFFQFIVFERVWGLHTSLSEWHLWSLKQSGDGTRGDCGVSVLLVMWNDWSGQREQNWCRHVHAAFQECSLNWSRHWAVLSLALRMAVQQSWRTRSAVWDIEEPVLSLFLCSLLFSRVFVRRKSVKAREWDHITLSFLSGLQICIFRRLPRLIKRSPCSLASYCWHWCFFLKHFVLVISKRKLDLMGDWSDPMWSIGNVSIKRKDS